MQKEEIQQLYSKLNWPKKFKKINGWLAICISVFFIFTGATRCTNGKRYKTGSLLIAPAPLNEINIKEILKKSKNENSYQNSQQQDEISNQQNSNDSGWGSENTSNTQKSQKNLKKQQNPEKKKEPVKKQSTKLNKNISKNNKENEYFRKYLNRYAQKVSISDEKSIYRLQFSLKSLPVKTGFYGELALEVYDEEQNYLFTFYADNYWNEKGYDDGYWHEWSLSDEITVRFPKKGNYYILAAVPLGSRNYYLYDLYSRYSSGRVWFSLFKGYKSLSAFPIVLGVIIFLITGFILLGSSSSLSAYAYYASLDVKNYHYLFLKKDKDSGNSALEDRLYYMKAFSKGASTEMVLEQEGKILYFEIELEEEIDDEDGSRTSTFYYYLYDEFPEEDFDTVPTQDHFRYKGIDFYKVSEHSKKEKLHYTSGMQETFTNMEIVYGSKNEHHYLCFEYKDDPSDFDVSLGHAIHDSDFQIWRVKK